MMLDGKTGAPLFNDTAWKKAKCVLDEILAGHCADPPGMQFYFQSLDVHGKPAFDEHGIPLLDCNRGTNDTENTHKQIITTFGTWNCGVEMSDYLMAERRHRHTHLVSERRRSGFPVLGHFDTWLIDRLQLLVEQNRNVYFYPSWPNTADFAPTSERFGTVPLHSEELGKVLAELKNKVTPDGNKQISDKAISKFTSDQRYLCKCMGTVAPFLPVHGEKENKLFDKLIRSKRIDLDMDQMALDWCDYVDGIEVFPKLPVYLRTHYANWLRNVNVREAVKVAAKGKAFLKQINEDTSRTLFPSLPAATVPAAIVTAATMTVATMTAATMPVAASTFLNASDVTITAAPLFATGLTAAIDVSVPQLNITTTRRTVSVAQHPPISEAVHPKQYDSHLFVGGSMQFISTDEHAAEALFASDARRKPGQRTGDKKKRQIKKCKSCLSAGRPIATAESCRGRSAGGVCQGEEK